LSKLPNQPRKNGELVFEAPWESRAFGLAMALTDDGRLPFEDFRSQLVECITAEPDHPYYEQWLEAFETAVVTAGLVGKKELARRTGEFASLEREEAF